LLKSTRQQYHQRIAHVLVKKFPEIAKTQPEILARHYTEAGLREKAIVYWQFAGQRAIKRSANIEAIHHFTKGLELLKNLPDTPERAQIELDLQTALGSAYMAIKGYAALEVEKAYSRAQELWQRAGMTPRYFPVLRGLWAPYLVRGELKEAREVAEVCMGLAQYEQDNALLMEACRTLGVTLFCLGELVGARTNLEQCMERYDAQQHFSLAFIYGQDSGVTALSIAALVLWLLGYPDQALKKNQEALALAQQLSHAHSQAYALSFTAFFHQLRREVEATYERAESAVQLASEKGFRLWIGMGAVYRGWALTERGELNEGILQMGEGLSALLAAGAKIFRPHWLALYAEACGKDERAEENLRALDEAIAAMEQSDERWCEAELYRLKGKLLMQNAKAESEAEACFHQAIEAARRQQAKSWELRVAMSLSRLWQKQNKKQEAQKLLTKIYGWFTEGFGTRDLQEAKALLDELSRY
jgi:predicted ATPase